MLKIINKTNFCELLKTINLKSLKYIFTFFLLLNLSFVYCQTDESNLKLGLGTSFFNINENFDDIFLFNNSSPIIIGIKKKRLRLESISNLSILQSEIDDSNFIRGSIRLSLDYFFNLSKKMRIYTGPQYGLNSNKTHLINLHVGGEYFLHKNWSISNQIGLNFLFDDQKFIQTNSSIVLRFYVNLSKKRDDMHK